MGKHTEWNKCSQGLSFVILIDFGSSQPRTHDSMTLGNFTTGYVAILHRDPPTVFLLVGFKSLVSSQGRI